MDCVCSGFDTPCALSNDRLAYCGFDETAVRLFRGKRRAFRLPPETAPIAPRRCALLAMTTGSWWGTPWCSLATDAVHASPHAVHPSRKWRNGSRQPRMGWRVRGAPNIARCYSRIAAATTSATSRTGTGSPAARAASESITMQNGQPTASVFAPEARTSA